MNTLHEGNPIKNMSNKKTNIFFDLDGTLIDIQKRHYKVYEEIVENLGGVLLTQRMYWKLKRNKSTIKKILRRSRIRNEKQILLFQKLFKNKIERIENLKLDILLKDVVLLLTVLQKKYDLYLLTLRRSKKNTLTQIEKLGIKKFFKEIIIRQPKQLDCQYKKSLLEKLQWEKYDIIVGDSEADILTANELGLISVAVLSGIRDRKYLKSLKPAYILEDINSLPKILT